MDARPPLSTSVPELRSIANALLDHLESTGTVDIELSHDYFWCLDAADRRDLPRAPGEGTIGQLSESLTFLRSSLDSGDLLGYGLVWLSEIFRTIGEDAVG